MVVFEAPLNPRDFTGEGSVITLSGVCCLPHLYDAKRFGLIHSPPFLVFKKQIVAQKNHENRNPFTGKRLRGSYCGQQLF
jgi:hypothetical protein